MAITMSDVRAKYPQYSDMSDEQLASALHQKFYSDMPQDEFNQKIGYTQPTDKKPNVQDQGPSFGSMFKQTLAQGFPIPGQGDLSQVIVRNPIKNLQDFVQGAVQAPIHLAQLLTPNQSSIGQKLQSAIQATSGIGSGDQSMDADIARGYGAAVPYALAGGPLGEALGGIVGKVAPMASQGAKSILGQMIVGGAQGAAETSPGGNKTINALIGTAAGAAPGIAGSLTEALRPTRLLRGTLSPDEIAKNVRAAGGSQTNIGKIVGDSVVSRTIENVASKLYGSGQPEAEASTRDYINNEAQGLMKDVLGTDDIEHHGENLKTQGENILDDLKGQTTSSNVLQDIQDDVTNKYSSQVQKSKSLYDARNKESEQDPNFVMQAPSFEKNAPALKDSSLVNSVLSDTPELQQAYNKLRGDVTTPGSFEQSYRPNREYPSLQEATLLKAKLNQSANSMRMSPDMTARHQAGIISNLAKHVDSGIKLSIENSGNQKLQSLAQTADKNYSENLAPFLDKNIYSMIEMPSNRFDPDTILSKTVKTGEGKDMANTISNLTNILGKNDTKLAYSYLAPSLDGNGNVNLDVLSKRWNKLGERQKETLINNNSKRKNIDDLLKQHQIHSVFKKAIQEHGKVNPSNLSTISENILKDNVRTNMLIPSQRKQQRMSNFVRLKQMNEHNSAFNPPTGQQTLDTIVPAVAAHAVAHGAGALAAGLGAGSLLGPVGGAIGGLAGLLLSGKAVSPLVKAATSPSMRKSIVKEMTNPTTKYNTQFNQGIGNALTQGLLNTLLRQNNG